MRISDVISTLEAFAPTALQESYDNTGLQVGDKSAECTGVLLCVDVTPQIIEEAVSKGCNLIVSHHPILFKGLKRIVGATLVERTVISALSSGISIYSCHTSLDSTIGGVSWKMAERLGLKNVRVLEPQNHKLMKLSVIIPDSHVDVVRTAIFNAGAGEVGNYDCCGFMVNGTGSFRAKEGANPYVGEIGKLHNEAETRLDVVLPVWMRSRVEVALLQAHPYEVPAYEFVLLENSATTGLGVVGELDESVTAEQLVKMTKNAYASPMVRCTAPPVAPIKTIALCGGSGASLICNAIGCGAQAYISSDIKYHDFIDNAERIFILDIGHFEGEQCTKEIFYHVIREKFPNFAVYYSETEKNPINYL